MYNPKLNRSGLPQIYKDISFYPLKLRDEDHHSTLTMLLSYNKNTIADKNIIKMSYLKFLIVFLDEAFDKAFNDGVYIVERIERVLSFVTKEKVTITFMRQKENDDEYFSNVDFFINFGNKEITEWEFEEVRKILLEQNGISMKYIEQYDKTLEEHLNFIHRGNKSGDFEEQLFSYCAYMRLPIDVVETTHTFYQFQKMMQRVRLLITFSLFKPLETSGQITMKDSTIEDWLAHIPERGRYDDILVEKTSFINGNEAFKVIK